MTGPTALEQEMLFVVNRMRMNPADELDLLINSSDANVNNAIDSFNVDLDLLQTQWNSLSAAAPLAWSEQLHTSADTHSQLMIEFDTQSHNLPDEPSLGQRFSDTGYQWNRIAENIFAYSKSVFHGHAGFAIDWGFGPGGIQDPAGHRDSIMNGNFREIGIDITPENDPSTNVGPLLITQHFANRNAINNKGWLLGSLFRDVDSDTFYDAGEGLNDIEINVTGINGTSFSQTLMPMDAGGYQILLDAGQYEVEFERDGTSLKTETVTISNQNVNVDYIDAATPPPDSGKGKIVGNKFEDLNGDGIWDSNESGLSGWTVFLDANGNRQLDAGEQSTTTDANGEYVFNNLDPGTYTVAEVLPAGWEQTAPDPANPTGSEFYQLDDGANENFTGYNSGDLMAFNAFEAQAGFETINSISVELSPFGNPKAVYLYQDLDNDNRPDSNEKLLEVSANLTGTDGFANIAIPETTVSGTFFVAALYEGNGSTGTYVPQDFTSPAGKSWTALASAGTFDPDNFSAFAFGNNWMLRANAPGALGQTVTVAADETVVGVNFGSQQTESVAEPTPRDDTLVGTSGDDTIKALAGNDVVSGEGGNDTLWGNNGNDTLNGNAGADKLLSGWGDDLLNGGDQNDSLYGGDQDDTLYGDRGSDLLNGGKHNDLLHGGDDGDTLNGSKGNDTLWGDAGADRLIGGGGADALNGGSDNDRLIGNAGDDLLNGDSGKDTLMGGNHNDTLNGGDDNDLLNSGSGNDELNGEAGDDRLLGSAGNDTLNGNNGNDFLNGGNENDLLTGNAGNDRLIGGDGDDTLIGTDAIAAGAGELDVLIGQSGADTFVLGDATTAYYSAQGWTDRGQILDFTVGEDAIVLHGTAADYQLREANNHTQIRLGSETIGVVIGVTDLDLTDTSTFSFV
ncbi:MAG: SdrD B-like domain-containing protein [Cyanobacteriota bacterium]|nr:SdrD B-like domain-containing protein [Cyanobacteriota bacterium]